MLEQIETFGFVEHQDFEMCFPKTGSAKARPLVLITKTLCISRQMPKNGRPTMRYLLFLDMVKELALFEGNDAGIWMPKQIGTSGFVEHQDF